MSPRVFITPPAIGERSIVMSVCVCVCVCVCLSVCDHISGTTRPIFTNFLRVLPMAVARFCVQRRGPTVTDVSWSVFVCLSELCQIEVVPSGLWTRVGPRNRALGGGRKPLPGKGAPWGTPLRCGLSSEFFDHLALHSAAAAVGLRALQWRSRDFSMAL